MDQDPNHSKGQRFPKSVRIRKRGDYLAVQNRGKKFHLDHVLAFVLPGSSRFGITVSAKVGNAVKRNRVKRLLREVIRRVGDEVPRGFDIVFVAKKNAVLTSFGELKRQLSSLGRKLRSRGSHSGTVETK